MTHSIVSGRSVLIWTEMSLDNAWTLLSTTAWVSVLSTTDSTQGVQRQRTHGQFAAPSVEERGCRCWRRAATSLLVCRRPLWAGRRCGLVCGRRMSYERVDTACTRSVVQWVTNATRGGRELHGHVVSDRERVSLPRSGLAAAVPELPLEDPREQRCSSPVATAREPRPVVHRHHDRKNS